MSVIYNLEIGDEKSRRISRTAHILNGNIRTDLVELLVLINFVTDR